MEAKTTVKTSGAGCSWIGHGGRTHGYRICLHTLPTGFVKETRKIYISFLRSPTLLERSFPNLPSLCWLQIQRSNVSAIRPGAFRGLPSLETLDLTRNQITTLESDVFFGLKNLTKLCLDKNAISVVSKHAFRGLSRLVTLHMEQNRLTSVPVDALLLPTRLNYVNLGRNLITRIDNDTMLLSHNGNLSVEIRYNKLRCDENLTWFICNLCTCNLLHQKLFRSPCSLRCASPDKFRPKTLFSVRKDFCQTYTDRPSEGTASMATTENKSAVKNTVTHYPYNKTVPTENYTESPPTSVKPVSQSTTEMDFVILLGGGPITNKGDNGINTLTMTSAVVAPLLLVLASAGVLFIYSRWRGAGLANPDQPTDDDGPESSRTERGQNIDPADMNSATARRPSTARNQTSVEDDTIQPYAVAYDKDDGTEIKPYAVAYDENEEPTIKPYAVAYDEDGGPAIKPYAVAYEENEGPEIKPYAVAYKEDIGQSNDVRIPLYAADTLPNAGGSTEAGSTPLENGTDQQATDGQSDAPSRPNDDEVQQENDDKEEENGNPSTSDGKGPYDVKEQNEIPTASGIYGNGSQPSGSEDHSTSQVLYNPECQTSETSVLYGQNPIDTGPANKP
ncbi:hypothetical protein Bbelb_184720 [Branchiostoma belcheri]|nr:hypothetical protein Bbelb_184720 [Branchiostoma belcheri]